MIGDIKASESRAWDALGLFCRAAAFFLPFFLACIFNAFDSLREEWIDIRSFVLSIY